MMLQNRMEAATMVAERLFALEAALDSAIAEAGSLVTTMPEARKIAKMSATVGHDAVESASETIAALTNARMHVMKLHAQLEETRIAMGLRNRVLGMGDLGKLLKAQDSNNDDFIIDDTHLQERRVG